MNGATLLAKTAALYPEAVAVFAMLRRS